MTRRLQSLITVLAITLACRGALRAQVQPCTATDQDDYSPGSTVSISGAQFRPNETVRLQILQIVPRDNEGPEHQPWRVQADANGRFRATWLVKAHEAGAKLRLTATGLESGLSTQTIFTDAAVVPASGGGAIPADTYTGSFTALTGPVLTETQVGDISAGTIVLTAPTGFVFDTNAPFPFITLAGDNNNKNINGLADGSTIALTVSTNSLSFTITSKSKGQTKNTLTYSNIRVRPTAAAPLASGSITNTGTSLFPNSTADFGTLTEVAGASTQLVVSGFPNPQTSGIAGNVTVTAQDQFGNGATGYTGTIHFTSSDAQAVLPADYTFVSGDNGVHTFAGGVTLKTIGTQSISVSNMAPASFTGTQSGISVVPALADHLAFAVQPGSTTYGSLLSPQPVVVSKDAFGNNSTVGLGASKTVSVTLTSGSGQLIGTASVDIGTGAGNGTATFTNLTVNAVGAGLQLTASAAGLSDAVSSSFSITTATVTANVTVNNKPYDGTTTASIATRSLSGVLGGDNVTLTGGTAAFTTKTVGNGKQVTITGLSLSGTSAANYVLASTSVTTSANITTAPLTVSGIAANNKVYNATTAATLNTAGAALVGVLGSDVVTLNTASATGTFSSKTVGTGKTVTVSGLTLSGADASNYALTQPTSTANVTTAGLTVFGIAANNKVYNATTAATLNTAGAALVGILASDAVTLNTASATGTFSSKTVGSGKTVTVSGLTLSGADASNYALTQPTPTANITTAVLTVSGVVANSKVYDGTTVATLNTAGAALVGVFGSDAVTLNTGSATGAFGTRNVGTGKTVTVSGLALSGADASNYALTQPTPTANITAAALTVTGLTAGNKVYDTTTVANLSGAAALAGVLGSDVVTLSGTAAGAFNSKTVGTGKTVSVSGLSLTGPDAGNYTLSQPSLSANITSAPLSVTGITADNKAYDATTAAMIHTAAAALAGKLGSDDATLNTSGAIGTFADADVGTAKTVSVSGLAISGTDAGNYALSQPITTADITLAGLTVTGISASNKVYDDTTDATLQTNNAALVGVEGADQVTLVLTNATATFDSKAVGTAKTVTVSGLEIVGPDAGKYTLTQPLTNADITPATVTITGLTANNKVYDSTTAAGVSGTAALSGVLGSDDVALSGTAAGTFSDKAVATAKSVNVSGLSLSGADSDNYTLGAPSLTADITVAGLSVSGLSADNKVYDGTTGVSLSGTTVLTGVLGSDDVALSGTAAGAFNDKTVGASKSVNVSGLGLAGADAGNYTLSQLSLAADITTANLSVSGLSANNKVYDGTTAAGLSGTFSLVGVQGSDTVTLSGTAVGLFSDKAVGSTKTVTVSGLSLSGTDAGNYTLSEPGLLADITPAGLSVSGLSANNKVYDSTTIGNLSGAATLAGIIGSDAVALSGTAIGTFNDKTVGNAKAVNVTGLSLAGADAGNYSLSLPVLAANISGATLSVTGITADNKAYDATTAAVIHTAASVLVGKLGSDDVTLDTAGAIGTFADADVATAKTVSVSGLNLSGTDAGNYGLVQPTTTADITPAGLTVTGIGANDKVYDGTTEASLQTNNAALAGVESGDQVILILTNATGAFDTKAVGSGKTVTVSGLEIVGPDAAKYTLTQPTTNADITPATLTVTGLNANNKVYDSTTASSLTGTESLAGVLGSDDVALTGTATGAFSDKTAGNGKTVNVSGQSLSGADAGNYTLSEPDLLADITPADLSVAGLAAGNKVYDGTTVADLTGTATLAGVLGSDVVTLSGAALGTFSDKTAGAGKAVSVSGLSPTGADAGNYSLSQPSLLADITPTVLTINGLSANNKVYDSATTAGLSGTAALVGVLGSDDVALSGAAIGTFSDKTVGTARTVSVTGLSLTGADASNYSLSLQSLAANIAAAPLSVAGVTADNKAYDGTTAAVIHATAAVLVGKLGSDNVALNTAGATGTFADADVGTAKSVNVSGLSISGSDAGNYGLVQPTATADITPAGLTVTGIGANDKVYDGTTEAGLQTNNAALVGVESGDQVNLILTNATGTFDTKAVGSGKTVTVSGLEIVGPDAGKYTLTQPTTNADITPATLTVTGLAANNKVYDSTTAASLSGTAGLDGVLGSDDVALSGTASATFNDKTVGTAKTVNVSGLSLSGADGGNYAVSEPGLLADITPAELIVTGLSPDNKVYDSTTAASLSGTAGLDGVLGGDDVTLNGIAAGAFSDKTVGAGKTVNVSGLDLSGTDAGNYTYAEPSLVANITPVDLSVTGLSAHNKVYDNTTAAGLSGTPALVGALGSDAVVLSGTAVGTFNDRTVGAAKPVSVSGLNLSGSDSGNYTLSQPTLAASITPLVLSVSGITADNKAFDGTTVAVIHTGAAVLVGKLGSDDVTLNTAGAIGTVADADVGIDKTVSVSGLSISGTDAANYALSQPSMTANITPAGLTVTGISASDKVYDGTTEASLQTSNAVLVGVLSGHQVTLILTNATGVFDSKAVATAKTVNVSGLEIVGPDASEYTLTQPTTNADITPATLTVTGLTANNRVYDSTTAASLSGTALLTGVLGSDDVALSSSAVGAFSDKTVGTAKTVNVSGLSLSGADAGNYTLNEPSLLADISPAALVVSGFSANDKVYDRTTTAALSGSGTLVGVLSTDDVTLNGTAVGTFSDKTVGAGKTVDVSGIDLSGADAGNYTYADPSLVANITPAVLTVSGLSANSKVYDTTTSASLSGTATLAGVLPGDVVTLSGAAVGAFNEKTVGAAKTVNASGLSLSGADAGNYTLNQSALAANITPATLSVSGITADNKTFDGTTAAVIHDGAAVLLGKLGSDDVLLNTAGATAAFSDPTVGAAKTINVSGLSVSGADAGNYNLLQPTTSADITVGTLTVTGISANDKVYDGTTQASLQTNSAALVGVQSGDQVLLILTNVTASFSSKAVGTSKTVTVGGLTVVGPDAGNYTLTQPTAHANITPTGLTVSGLSANSKAYNGSAAAALSGTAALVGVLGSDAATLSGTAVGTFDNETVGTAKTVIVSGLSLTGADSGNYILSQPSLLANITAAGLTVSGLAANDKVYDSTVMASLSGAAVLVGVLGSDVVTLSGTPVGTFNNKTVATAKTVIVNGLSLVGADAGNYTLSLPSLLANITPAALTVSGLSANNKVYDGTSSANLSGTAVLSGVLGGDSVTFSGIAVGSFGSKAVGTGKTVNVNGLSLAGAAAGNYTLSTPSLQANVTSASLVVTATANNKVYDATTVASANLSDNRVAGDALSISYTAAAFVDKNVGNSKTVNVTGISVTGTDAANYVANTTATAIAAINPATLTGTVGNQTRWYGTANPGFSVNYTGFVNGENSSLLSGSLSFNTTANISSPVGSYAVTASAQSAANYTIHYVAGTLTVTPASLTVAANNATRSYGAQNPQFTASFTGFVNGEKTNVLGGTLTLITTAQANSTPGDYPIVPGGVVSSNYSITFVNGTLTVISANDFLEITVGSTNLMRGKGAAVPIYVASSEGVTNLTFSMAWPAGHLSNAALVATGPAMAACSLQDQGTNLVFSMQTVAGQVLQGTQQLAQLSFMAISNQNPALLPLPIQHTSAVKPNGSSYTNCVAPTATIAVIGGEPFLFASTAPDSSRSLTLYGLLGVNYQLQYATNLGAPTIWTPAWNYVQTNNPITIGVDAVHQVMFYRLFKP